MIGFILRFVGALLTIGVGYLLLYTYFRVDTLAEKVINYSASTILTTVGVYSFFLFVEVLVRRFAKPKVPFSESLLWLSPCMFTLYQFYAVDDLVLKSVLGILVLVFAFLFVLSLTAAISDTALAKKKINIYLAGSMLVLMLVGAAYLLDDADILILIPLLIVISYANYILVNFLQVSPPEESGRSQQRTVVATRFRRLIPSPMNVSTYFEQSFLTTLLLMLLFVVPFVLYIKGVFTLPDTISNLYAVSLTVYVVLLSIITAFAIGTLRRQHDGDGVAFKRALLGLSQMCVVFIIVSLIGILTGLNRNPAFFTTPEMLRDLLHSETFMSDILSIMQVLVLETVVLSFPATIMYVYGLLKNMLHGDNKSA